MSNTRISFCSGKTRRVILARIQRDSDLVSALIEICREAGIVTGAVEVSIGSLRKAELSWTVPSATTKRGSERTKPLPVEGPLEFINGQGLICLANPDKPAVHFHGVVCDKEGRLWGGHFFPGGNTVHSTMDVMISELEGVKLGLEYDPEIDLELLTPRPLARRDEKMEENENEGTR